MTQEAREAEYVLVPRDLAGRIYDGLENYYGNVCTYRGERTGGVLAGCPRAPDPTPDQLVVEARALAKQLKAVASAPAYAGTPPPSAPSTCWQHRVGAPCPTPASCRDNGCSAVERELYPSAPSDKCSANTLGRHTCTCGTALVEELTKLARWTVDDDGCPHQDAGGEWIDWHEIAAILARYPPPNDGETK